MTRPAPVLLAAADRATREFFTTTLQALGRSVTVVETGADAWASYQQSHVRLVILDVDVMPSGGPDICRRIRAADPSHETFIIACADQDAQGNLPALLDAGADDFLAKPVTVERLNVRLAIAERRLAQETTRRMAEAELARARWLAGIGELTIALQHEINNPLSALMSHAEVALLDAADRGERDEQIETILQQAQRIAEVVKRIGALRNPMSTEYLPGTSMIDLGTNLGTRSNELPEAPPPARKPTP